MSIDADPALPLLGLDDEAAVLSVLGHSARQVGVDFDPAIARQSYRAACQGTCAYDGWAGPFMVAADSVGLHARIWHGTARAAWSHARDDLPVVAPSVSAGQWWVLGGKRSFGRVSAWTDDSDGRPNLLSWSQFSAGTGGADELRPWFLVSPAAPATDLIGKPGAKLGPFGRLLALLQTERQDLGVVLAYAIGVGILGLATPLVVQVLVNTVAFTALSTPVFILAFILLACLTFAAILRGLKRYAVEVLQRRVFVRMSADLAWRLPRVKVSAFDRKRASELVNHFFDVLTVQKAASSLLIDGLSAAIQAAVGLLLLAVYHPALLGFGIFLVAAIAVLMVGLGGRGPATAIAESRAKYRVAGWLEEVAGHSGLFKLPGGARLAIERADDLSHAYLDAREAHFQVFFRQYVGTLGLQVVAATVLLGLGGWLVVERQLSLGQLVAAELVVAAVLAAYAKFADKLDIFYDLLAGLDKLGVLVDLPIERQTGIAPATTGEGVGLELGDVGFAFPGGGPVLRQVDMRLMPGETVVIYGSDGAGKSVLADLMFGLRTPTSGHVRLDGVDLRELRPKAVRGCSTLTRGPEVVTGTIAENVALGRGNISRDAVRQALDFAGLGEVVGSLPRGLETEVSPTGAPLSHTQVLRLMLARAVAGRPRLIIVDHTLDGLAGAARDGLIAGLTAEDATWTVVVLTQDRRLVGRLDRSYSLRDGILIPAVAGSEALGLA